MKKTLGLILIILGLLIYISLYALVAISKSDNKYILIFTLGYVCLSIIPIGIYLRRKNKD